MFGLYPRFAYAHVGSFRFNRVGYALLSVHKGLVLDTSSVSNVMHAKAIALAVTLSGSTPTHYTAVRIATAAFSEVSRDGVHIVMRGLKLRPPWTDEAMWRWERVGASSMSSTSMADYQQDFPHIRFGRDVSTVDPARTATWILLFRNLPCACGGARWAACVEGCSGRRHRVVMTTRPESP